MRDPKLHWLNQLPPNEAQSTLRACCAASAWVHAMLVARPFASREDLHRTAERLWRQLGEDDWLQAFRAHPRIGDRVAATGRALAWSSAEQAAMNETTQDARAELARLNDVYFDKFGFIFIICAQGLGAEQMLASLKTRLTHDRATELRAAAAEQAKITRLRLNKLLGGAE